MSKTNDITDLACTRRRFTDKPVSEESVMFQPQNLTIVGAIDLAQLDGNRWNVTVDGVDEQNVTKVMVTIEVGQPPKVELTKWALK